MIYLLTVKVCYDFHLMCAISIFETIFNQKKYFLKHKNNQVT